MIQYKYFSDSASSFEPHATIVRVVLHHCNWSNVIQKKLNSQLHSVMHYRSQHWFIDETHLALRIHANSISPGGWSLWRGTPNLLVLTFYSNFLTVRKVTVILEKKKKLKACIGRHCIFWQLITGYCGKPSTVSVPSLFPFVKASQAFDIEGLHLFTTASLSF